MADGALSIKLRCASWQQLATIYRRDLSQGTMFLKAAAPPPIGTSVHIDLALPSATVIELTGVVQRHVDDPQRGAGVELKLAPIATGSVWLIESALASEHKRLATPIQGVPVLGAHQMTGIIPTIPTITDSADVTAAEHDLIRALVSEAESLKKLNPFLVLGVGYEATDAEVRGAFGELTKRYHPDRFARYESAELRRVAAEIFILIRDAYRRLGDTAARAQLLQSLGKSAPAPRAVPAPPRVTQAVPPPRPTQRVPVLAPPPPVTHVATTTAPTAAPTAPTAAPSATAPTQPAPTIPPGSETATPGPARPAATPRRASTRHPLGDSPTSPPANTPPASSSGPPRRAATDPGASPTPTYRRPLPSQPPPAATGEPLDVSALEQLIDQGRLDDALAAYRQMTKKHPHDRNVRAGVELCEGLLAFAARDRLEAAQRFEAALEIDPSNERAARELADMRRQATNERKGLLSRLMGKKEP
jgi:tetratricopeptide (TPR) repeat protein